jgi:hypothetical protein
MFPCLEKQGGGRRSVNGRPKKKGTSVPFLFYTIFINKIYYEYQKNINFRTRKEIHFINV